VIGSEGELLSLCSRVRPSYPWRIVRMKYAHGIWGANAAQATPKEVVL
jgi:hypothetical protein